jgi:hypothetical protein
VKARGGSVRPKGSRNPKPKAAVAQAAPAAPKRGRGRPKAGPRLGKRRNGEYQILGYGTPIPLNTFDEAAAEIMLEDEKYARRNPGRAAPNANVLIKSVIEELGHVARAGSLRHLLKFWGAVTLKQITRDLCWAYMDWREEDKVARGTLINELSNLRNLVNRYCTLHKILIVPIVYMPDTLPANRGFLRVREVLRLFGAADGRIWDLRTKAWSRDANGDLILQPEAWRERALPMQRLLRFCIWTGSRVDTVLRASWKRQDRRGHVNLKVGNFVRRGRNEKLSLKRKPPVKLTPTLMQLAFAWRKEDEAARFDHDEANVIHDLRGKRIGVEGAWRLFAEIREAAGLDARVTIRILRSSCAVWLMENGCTPTEAAEFLGNTAGVLSAFYDHYAPDFSLAAAAALDSRTYAELSDTNDETAEAVDEIPQRRQGVSRDR